MQTSLRSGQKKGQGDEKMVDGLEGFKDNWSGK